MYHIMQDSSCCSITLNWKELWILKMNSGMKGFRIKVYFLNKVCNVTANKKYWQTFYFFSFWDLQMYVWLNKNRLNQKWLQQKLQPLCLVCRDNRGYWQFLLCKLHVSTLIVIGDVIRKRMQPSLLHLMKPDSGVKGAWKGTYAK